MNPSPLRLACLGLVLLAGFCSASVPVFGSSGSDSIPDEEYSIYDLVIQTKFLTSRTELVLIDRMTVTTLGGDHRPGRGFFEEHRFFKGALPVDGILDFVAKARRPWRLEPKFNPGVRYRFVSGETIEEPEVSLAPYPARRENQAVGYDPVRIGVLRFSRVGFNRAENLALVYVGDHRPDGSGAGFLMFLRRAGTHWRIADTEVLWAAQ